MDSAMRRGSIYGGILPRTQAWLVRYEGHDDLFSVLPTEADPPWTELAWGYAHAAVTDGVLRLTCSDENMAVRWWLEEEQFTNARGVVLDALVRLEASSSLVDTGLLFEVRDGECQFVVFLRADGLNIHGQEHVDFDLTDKFHHIVLAARGIDCRLYVDGQLVQVGHLTALVDEQRVGFGTAIGYGFATAQFVWVKGRQFYTWETMFDGGFVMQIGPFDETIVDLPKFDPAEPSDSLDPESATCCWRILAVDHSDEAQFTLAEPPVVTDQAGEELDEDDILVHVLPGSDGEGFRLLVMNMGSDGNMPYAEGTDIGIRWTRKGLVAV